MKKVKDEFNNNDKEFCIVRDYINGTGTQELAKKYHYGTDKVSKILGKYNVKGLIKAGRKKYKDTLENKIVRMYCDERMTIVEISEELGISKLKVRKILKSENVKINTGGQGKLNKEAVKRMHAVGIDNKTIAEIFEVSISAIINFLRESKTEEEKEEEKKEKERQKKKIDIKEGDKLTIEVRDGNERVKKEIEVESANCKYIICRHKEGYKETFTITDLIIGFTNKKIQLVQH